MNNEWTYCLSYFSKSGDSFMLIHAEFSHSSFFKWEDERNCGPRALFIRRKGAYQSQVEHGHGLFSSIP